MECDLYCPAPELTQASGSARYAEKTDPAKENQTCGMDAEEPWRSIV
jgi:hypothetical protein